jgi:hypothetical protein
MAKRSLSNKAKKSKARGAYFLEEQEETTIMDVSSDSLDDVAPPNPKKKKRKKKNRGRLHKFVREADSYSSPEEESEIEVLAPRKWTSHENVRTSVSDDESGEDDDQDLIQSESVHAGKFLSTLQQLSNMKSVLVLRNWLKINGQVSTVSLHTIEEQCGKIAKLIREEYGDREPKSTIKDLEHINDKYYIYRDRGTKIKLLRLEADLHANRHIRNKAFAFLTEEGAQAPSMYALSGVKTCVKPHPLMLDSTEWTAHVFRHATFHGKEWRAGGFETNRGDPKGTDSACHAESQLMLAFACRASREFHFERTGKRVSNYTAVGMVHNLLKRKSRLKVTITIDRDACKSCEDYRADFEVMAGIKFTFEYCYNLGVLGFDENKHGHRLIPKFASENLPDYETRPKAKSPTFEVVIHPPRQMKEIKVSFERYRYEGSLVGPVAKVSKKRHLAVEDPNDSDFSPPKSTKPYSTPKKSQNSSRNGLLTPDSNPFLDVAYKHADRIKKKRTREVEEDESPSKSKRARYKR